MALEKLTLKETQSEELRLLTEFDKLCRDHNLQYYLAYGTCLGAIRHKGFIPWDDDTDVYMPRPDYEKLAALNPTGDDCKLMNRDDPLHCWGFGKFVSTKTYFEEPNCQSPKDYGVFIDIFPVDGMPENSAWARMRFRIICKLLLLEFYTYYYTPKENSTLKKRSYLTIISTCLRIIPRTTFRKMVRKLCTRYSFTNSQTLAVYEAGAEPNPPLLTHNHFKHPQYADFEGLKFPTVNNAESYLENLYGTSWHTPIKREYAEHGSAYWRSSSH